MKRKLVEQTEKPLASATLDSAVESLLQDITEYDGLFNNYRQLIKGPDFPQPKHLREAEKSIQSSVEAQSVLKDGIFLVKENRKLVEKTDRLLEMTTLRKRQSGLPVNVYLDNSMSYKRGKHPKRIKFQLDYSDKPKTQTFPSMEFDGDIIKTNHIKIELSQKDIEKIKNFISNNVIALSALADIEIEDFKEIMIIGGELVIEDVKKNQKLTLEKILKKKENER